jgi:hypothetical protein
MAVTNVAQMMLREVPLAQIHSTVQSFNPSKEAGGNVCGVGCSRATGKVLDQEGTSGVTHEDMAEAKANPAALTAALQTESSKLLTGG